MAIFGKQKEKCERKNQLQSALDLYTELKASK